jgi:acyl-CoA synthetase (NDP forming)/RimJ/RimL family protein N-acetyltransferase
VLSDGATVHIRPITPDDADALVKFHSSLSSESIYFRFFSPKPRLSEREIERFTHVDMHDRVALVATLAGELIAVGRYDRWPGKPEAEVAFTVADDQHGRGIATVLLEHLAAIARLRGITRFTAEVLPDNRAMLSVFRKAGFEVSNAFAGGIIDVAFPITPTPAFLETIEQREHRADARSIARLLRARSIAVIGASNRVGSVGEAVVRNLFAGGFDGPIYPVNPFVSHVAGIPAHKSILDIEDDVHLAVIAVSADQVRAVIEDCAQRKVRGVIVISTGFEEAGEDGSRARRELVELARGHGMRLIGPGSMGVISTPTALRASFTNVPVTGGQVAVSIQSGPMGIAMLELAKHLGVGISTFVSLGDKADVSANDLLNYWEDDDDTAVVLLYTESFGNPRKFGRVARRVSRRKPIVAVKSGRSGQDEDASAALYQQAGVIRVPTVRELFDTGRVLALQPLPKGPKVAVVSNATSPGRMTVDSLLAEGLSPAVVGVDARAELSAQLHTRAHVGEIIDLTFRAEASDYRVTLDVVLSEPEVDAAVVLYAPPIVDHVDEVASAITDIAAEHGKPVVAVMLGRENGPVAPGSPVPAFSFPEPACTALGRVTRYAEWCARATGTVQEYAVDRDEARRIIDEALRIRPGGTLLPLTAAASLLATYGIDFPPARAVTSLDAAVSAAEEMGYPVAVKAAGIERLARSESGGVALDLQDADDVRGAYTRMRDALGDAMAEAIVQRMVPAGVETIVRVDGHAAFGAVVSFGLGGAFADAIADRAARSVPLTDVDASDLVSSSRAARALSAAGASTDALIELVQRVGQLVDDFPELSRMKLNPVLASHSGAWVVDIAIHVAPPPALPIDIPIRRLM